jgi:hypothetical protein
MALKALLFADGQILFVDPKDRLDAALIHI